MMAELTDVLRAFNALRAKRLLYTTRFNYYDGVQPLRYSTTRLQDVFASINVYFSENWASVIVNSVLERLFIAGWTAKSTGPRDELAKLWQSLALTTDANDTHEAAVITGESFILAGQSDDKELELYHNDPRLCHMFYDPSHPKDKLFGAKMWLADDLTWKMNLYYPDIIKHFSTESRNATMPSQATAFKLVDDESNVFGVIPMFHFRVNRRKVVGELTPDILSLQDAVNKLLADMMCSAEFDTFRERIYITNQKVNTLKRKPGLHTRLRPAAQGTQPTDVKELGGSDLKRFMDALDNLSNSMASISRTPRHYFFSVGAGISGDALVAMEAPLTKKADMLRDVFSVTWLEIARFVMDYNNMGDVDKVTVQWRPTETQQPTARAQTILTLTQAGTPLGSAYRQVGTPEEVIEKIMEDKKQVDDKLTADAQAALEEARKAAPTTGVKVKGKVGSTPGPGGKGG
jgi:hypothetical protein